VSVPPFFCNIVYNLSHFVFYTELKARLPIVIISPLLQSMLGFRQAIFPAGEYVSDWVADVKKGLNSLYVYCPLAEPRMVIVEMSWFHSRENFFRFLQ
jgi:hypothetical protein